MNSILLVKGYQDRKSSFDLIDDELTVILFL